MSFCFIEFFVFSSFLFNNIEPGNGVYIMVYPLAIILLPFRFKPILLFFICFLFGFSIDFFLQYFWFALLCPLSGGCCKIFIFNLLSPRDGYEAISHPSIGKLGNQWAFASFSFILLIHHFLVFFD